MAIHSSIHLSSALKAASDQSIRIILNEQISDLRRDHLLLAKRLKTTDRAAAGHQAKGLAACRGFRALVASFDEQRTCGGGDH